MPNFYPLIRPFLWVLDAEVAHGLALSALRAVPGWCLPFSGEDDGLETTVWGRSFSNPLGLAAGFDKHAQASSALYRLGFGFDASSCPSTKVRKPTATQSTLVVVDVVGNVDFDVVIQIGVDINVDFIVTSTSTSMD